MTSDRVLKKMRAALLFCGAAGGCTRGATAVPAARDVDESAMDTDTGNHAPGAPDAYADARTDAFAETAPGDGASDAPYGTVACPIHPGGHPKLPDGGLDIRALLGTGGLAPLDGSVLGIGGIVGLGTDLRDLCLGCGMGGPRDRDSPMLGATTGTINLGAPAGHVTMSIAGTTATTETAARRAVMRAMPGTRSCYEKELKSAPSTAGALTLALQFDNAGHATIASAVPGASLGSVPMCVGNQFRAIVAPEIANASVTMRLVFSKR